MANERLPEITPLMTISTAHLSRGSLDALYSATHRFPFTDMSIPPVYAKDQYGYFLYVPEDLEDEKETMPADILACCEFAKDHGCSVICFDCDGPIVTGLKAYFE